MTPLARATRATKIAAIVCVMALAFLLFSAWRSQPRPPRSVVSEPSDAAGTPERATADEVEAVWASGPFRPLPNVETRVLASDIRTAMYGDTDGVPSGQMGALAAIIAEQLSAKAAETPDAYLRLIESDPHTRWLESPDPWFKELEYQWAWHGKDQPAEVFEDPLRRARWLIEFMRDNRESRPTEARLEPGDVFVRSARVRTEEQVRARLWSGTPGTETRRWIKGAAGPATQLRIAKRQIGEVLSEYGQTTVVETNMVVRSAGGHLSVWQAIWYWDPKVQTWSNYLMGRRAVTNPGYTGTYY